MSATPADVFDADGAVRPAAVDATVLRAVAALSPAQRQFLRSLGGETILFQEYSKVKVTDRTRASVGKRGLASYGKHEGSPTMGWRLTAEGEPVAQYLIDEARKARIAAAEAS